MDVCSLIKVDAPSSASHACVTLICSSVSWSWLLVDPELCTAGCLEFVLSKTNLEEEQYPDDVLCHGGDQAWSNSGCWKRGGSH